MKRTLSCLLLVLYAGMPAIAAADENSRLHKLLDQAAEELIAMSPQRQTSLGRKTNYDKWSDYSFEQVTRRYEWYKGFSERLASFDELDLSPLSLSNLAIARYDCKQSVDAYPWRFHDYTVTQLFSPFDTLPAFLINRHRIDTVDDARAYITRVATIDQPFGQIMEDLKIQAKKGILPPRFVFPQVITNIHQQLSGRPFQKDDHDTALLRDFKDKVAALQLDDEQRAELVAGLTRALNESFKPALEKAVQKLEQLQKDTTETAGVWKLPNGKAYYDESLAQFTTTELTADRIHHIGLDEVTRIEAEMRRITKALHYTGSLREFFDFLRNDPQFRYPDSDAGRQQYLDDTRELYDEVRAKLPAYFGTTPKAKLIVKRVEPFREQNTFAAFYEAPAIDGSRPGIYYVPMYRIGELLSWDMETTAFHEGIPGHHMQIAIAQELTDQPLYIRLSGFNAFSEGWALYAEHLAKEMGLYENRPYKDFGRLGNELFRAVRLVVDTGIHSQKWTRQQAIDYMVEHTPFAESFVTGEIERYIVWPGQATSYKVGMLKILELRRKAEAELGDKFDIRQFHDAVLTNGGVPLEVLEMNVNHWVASAKSASDSQHE